MAFISSALGREQNTVPERRAHSFDKPDGVRWSFEEDCHVRDLCSLEQRESQGILALDRPSQAENCRALGQM